MPARAAIYLDSNAGAPLSPQVIQALRPFLSDLTGPLIPNPSSVHAHGRKAKQWIADAREQVASSLGPKISPEQILFTSSGTEANQVAIRSVLEPELQCKQHPHWITTPVEHESIRQLMTWFESKGGKVSFLPVNDQGIPQVDFLDQIWTPQTSLVSAIWVNNETGVVSDVDQLSQEVKKRGGILHLDGAQAWGKLPIRLGALGAHLLTFSGHKIGALSGTGLVWAHSDVPVQSNILGKQERFRRGGTENVLGILSLGSAANCLDPEQWAQRVEPLRDRLERVICELIPATIVNGGGAPRVANTLNLSFEGIEGDGLVMALDLTGYSVSAGSACLSGAAEPSHVLMAMGRSKERALSSIRVSLPDATPWEILDGFSRTLSRTVEKMRQLKSAKG